jgi:hypothetical protein
MRGRKTHLAALAALAVIATGGPANAAAPAQRVPAALLLFPLVTVEGGGSLRDTRVELVNLSRRDQQLSCFYLTANSCGGVGFSVRLTANQPLSWLVSRGTFNSLSGSAIPPFRSNGELKCRVIPSGPEVEAHNVVQGRAIVFGVGGETIPYGAVGIQRLIDGEASRLAELDGVTYAQCPDEMHFVFVASEPGSQSEIVMTPCTQDLLNRTPTSTTVSILVYNEFEQVLSASTSVTCHARRRLEEISHIFERKTLGTDTGHLIVRGVQSPVLTMLIDRVSVGLATAVAANEPALRGGRAASIRFP